MKFTEEMIAEDEKRWHSRDIVAETGYCANYMRDRIKMRNYDIRFYAYLFRRAHKALKAVQEAQKPIVPHRNYKYLSDYWCECGWHLGRARSVNYCSNCGRKVDWSV